MIPTQMPALIEVLRQVDELPVVLCHAGSPWDQSAEGLANWRRGLEALAELPRVHCKLSGLGMFNPTWTPASLRPIVDTVIEVFTPARVMFGSNFPVDSLYRGYAAYWSAYDSLTGGYSGSERAAMFAGNARRFYRLTGY
jgi:predicted TIM-barrel fold metal-dependent hydrolase